MLTKVAAANVIAFYRAALNAPGTTPGTLLGMPTGSAAGLYVSPDGAWRPEGLALARRKITGALNDWGGGAGTRMRFKDGITADDARSTLDAYWGLTRAPQTLDVAGSLLGKTGQTVSNWETRVVESLPFRTSLSRTLPLTPDSIPVGPWPAWDSDPIRWPGDDGGATGWGEAARLKSDLTRMLEGSLQLDEDGVLQILRNHVADQVMDVYLASPHTSLLQRAFNGLVLTPWFWDDAATIRREQLDDPDTDWSPEPHKEDAHALRQLAPIVQLFAHDLVLPHGDRERDDAIRNDLLSRASIRHALLATPTRVAMRSVDLRPPRSEFEYAIRRDEGSADIVSALTPDEIRESASATDELAGRAREIRSTRFKENRLPMCETYLELREGINWDAIDEPDRVIIQVADHSVQLDLYRLRRDDLVRKLARLIRRHTPKSARKDSYKRLPDRIAAMSAARSQRFDVAMAGLAVAIRDVDGFAAAGGGDAKAVLESREQLRLTGAWIAARTAEFYLSGAQHAEPHPLTRRWIEDAHQLISQTHTLLGVLDSPRFGLGAAGGDEEYLSADTWRTLPPIIEFRIRTIACVAHKAGLLGDSVPFPIDTLETLEAEYIAVASIAGMPNDDILDILRSVMWMSFLGDGTVPAVPQLTITRAGFLDVRNPMAVKAWAAKRVTLDLEAIQSLFRNLGRDLGSIEKVRPDGAVARYLDTRSTDHAFTAWLARSLPES